ncbi:Rieske (2Fe-2S) protein [Foetidibacter luteolus]|uniref:Rieske (2Fe-2S) protein n=1 Tax=Foetidibacter luteolus TaxID=2608880 RepID=UPI00129A5611|nr:Rieske 2Fe-2S domain-containing protein [Foetidibacter luteolus]
MRKINWHKVAEDIAELNWQSNNMAIVEAGGKKITVARFKEQLFVFAYKCPHASGVLANGFMDALGNVVCPLHRYRFNMQNGRNTSGEGYYLKTYHIEQKEDGIYIGIESSGLFG